MVAEVIIVRISLFDDDGMLLVKLYAIEAHGIWIESQDFTNQLMEKLYFSTYRTTPIVFIPLDKVDFIMGALDSLSFSERTFVL